MAQDGKVIKSRYNTPGAHPFEQSGIALRPIDFVFPRRIAAALGKAEFCATQPDYQH